MCFPGARGERTSEFDYCKKNSNRCWKRKMRWLETVLSCIPTEQAPKKVRGTKFPDCRVSSSLTHEKKAALWALLSRQGHDLRNRLECVAGSGLSPGRECWVAFLNSSLCTGTVTTLVDRYLISGPRVKQAGRWLFLRVPQQFVPLHTGRKIHIHPLAALLCG